MVQQAEQVGVVDLADVGFVAFGHACDLHMPHAARGQVLADLHGEVAFDDLAVVEVHLDLDVGLGNVGQQRMGLVLAAQEEAGHVAAIDGLQQDGDAVGRGQPCGVAHVGDVGGAQDVIAGACGLEPGHDVDARAAQGPGIGDGAFHALGEFRLAPGDAGKTALARVPVAGRGVEQYLPQAVVLQAAGQLLGREVVGEQVFDGLEAVARGGLEAVKKVQVVVEHGQVGGETGHESFPENGC